MQLLNYALYFQLFGLFVCLNYFLFVCVCHQLFVIILIIHISIDYFGFYSLFVILIMLTVCQDQQLFKLLMDQALQTCRSPKENPASAHTARAPFPLYPRGGGWGASLWPQKE